MDMNCILRVICILFISYIGESANNNMFPWITEPKKNTVLQVLPGSDIDLCCSADLGDLIAVEYTMIYWIINGNFTDYYNNAQESNIVVTKKGNFTYISLFLHLYKVTEEFFNVPITCMLQTTSGNDMSTIYFMSLRTGHWKVIIPVILIALFLLVLFVYINYRAVMNPAH